MIHHQAKAQNLHTMPARNYRNYRVENDIILNGIKKQIAVEGSLVHVLYRIGPEPFISSLHISFTLFEQRHNAYLYDSKLGNNKGVFQIFLDFVF